MLLLDVSGLQQPLLPLDIPVAAGAASEGIRSTQLGNAGLIRDRDQRYRTDPDAGLPMPDRGR